MPEQPHFPVVAFAASVGGLNALSVILGGLPADFPAAVLIVLHTSPDHRSLMPEILGSHTLLRVKEAQEGDVLCPGCVFTAPPDHHLVVNPGDRLSLSQSPKVHFVRPSAELLFASAAANLGSRLVAVVLTGGDSDGSAGVVKVKQAGGSVIAQDEASSEVSSMPRSAVQSGAVDFVLPLERIAAALIRLVGR